ncbi:MAG TPA: TRAP transporter small permease [Burkholderiales bacterium]|jgi:TRAP-type C4-dicarboxylate transport system permease small subunit
MSRLAQLVSWFVALLLIVAVVINFSNVVGRYVFSQPLAWAEEALGFLQIGFVVIGAALVTRANAHLRMDAMEHLLPVSMRRWLDVAAGILTLAVALVVVAMSWRIASGMLANDTRSVVLEIPLALPYSVFVVGFGLMALFALARVIALLRRRR